MAEQFCYETGSIIPKTEHVDFGPRKIIPKTEHVDFGLQSIIPKTEQ
jgi:hypothetical protein